MISNNGATVNYFKVIIFMNPMIRIKFDDEDKNCLQKCLAAIWTSTLQSRSLSHFLICGEIQLSNLVILNQNYWLFFSMISSLIGYLGAIVVAL